MCHVRIYIVCVSASGFRSGFRGLRVASTIDATMHVPVQYPATSYELGDHRLYLSSSSDVLSRRWTGLIVSFGFAHSD